MLLLAFFISSVHLRHESIWYDEGWTLWAVLDVEPVFNVAPQDSIRGLISNVREAVARVRTDVHPPLYVLTFDSWTMATGDSVYSGRLFSTLWGMIGLAGTYALGVRCFNRKTALIACTLLASSSFFIYYNREIRMYSMVLALTVLTSYFYLIWSMRPTARRMIPYMLTMTALLYTHYAGAIIILAHIIHLLFTRLHRLSPRLIWWYVRPYIITFILFAPWIPILFEQIDAHPNGALAFPIPTNLKTIGDLTTVLTNNLWIIYAILVVRALWVMRHSIRKLAFLIIWVIVLPAFLLIINDTIINLYQNRYVIGILPAFMLLIAVALTYQWDKLPRPLSHPYLTYALVGFIVILQLTNYTQVWGTKYDWEGATLAVIDARDIGDPAITDIADNSVMGYYNRQYGVHDGITLNLSWRNHSYDEMRGYADIMNDSDSVWVVMPTNITKTWYLAGFLDESYVPTYRDSMLNYIYYRFDRPTDRQQSNLQFRIGDILRYNGDITGQYSVPAGGQFCPDPIDFMALQDLDTRYSVGLHLVLDHSFALVQWDGGLGAHAEGDTIIIDECIDVPNTLSTGNYHLRLVVYEWETVTNQPILEDGGDMPILWGQHLFIAEVIITNENGN